MLLWQRDFVGFIGIHGLTLCQRSCKVMERLAINVFGKLEEDTINNSLDQEANDIISQLPTSYDNTCTFVPTVCFIGIKSSYNSQYFFLRHSHIIYQGIVYCGLFRKSNMNTPFSRRGG